MATHVELVYVKCRDIPSSDYDFRYTSLDICVAAEQLTGRDTVEGCINSKGLLRLQPKTRTARNLILTTGLKLYDTSINVYDKNPFLRNEGATRETPSTRLVIGDIPFTLADSEIESALVRVGCDLRSSIMDEKVRYRDGKLSKFKSGRKFVFITVPTRPLERSLTIGGITASIFHKEQNIKPRPCSNCLQDGHAAHSCHNDVVCLQCKLPGHRKGDPRCPGVEETAEATFHGQDASKETEKNETAGETETESETDDSEGEGAEANEKSKPHVPAVTPPPANPAEPTAEVNTAHEKPAAAAATTPDAAASMGSAQDTAEDTPDGENNTKEKKKKKKKKKNKEQDEESRGRDRHVQTTLDFHSRLRSQTPKRPRETDGDSPVMEDRRARLE